MKKEKESSGMHIEQLKPEKPFEANPMVSIVETLMSKYLSGHNWRQYTVEGVLLKIQDMMTDLKIPKTERHYLILKKKITKCTSMEACLSILEEVLF